MLGTIFSFETKRWFSQPSFYIYFAVFFLIGFLVMASALGYFDAFTVTTTSNTYYNSPLAVNSLINGFSQLLNFIIPTVIGATVYRDYKYNVHSVLYSYPFSKRDYLAGKFLSGMLITIIISLGIGLAFIVASVLPFANQELMGPFRLWAFIQSYVLFVIPNIFFIGAIIFLLVTLTRNVYIGFIFILILLILQIVIGNLTENMDDKFIAALIEPYGQEALSYVSKYWSIEEQNVNDIPFSKAIVLNRLIWVGTGILALVITWVTFSFSQSPVSLLRQKAPERSVKDNFRSVFRINLPEVTFNFSFAQNLKTAFSLARTEFRSIVKNWVFISIVAVLMLFVFVNGYTLGENVFGTKTYPVTIKVLETISGVFVLFGQILIFLFAGVVLNSAATHRMNFLVDSTPVPDWVLLLSKFLALLAMCAVLMVSGMIAGMLVQAYYGYYHFEPGLYIKSLLGFRMLHFVVLIIFALFIQSFFKNYLLGFIVILVALMIPSGLSKIGIELPVFHFNYSPGAGYSDMNGFGSYRQSIIFRVYWLLFCGVLYGLTLLFWRRGIISGVKDRLQTALLRFKRPVAVPMLISLAAFTALGCALYYRLAVAQPFYTSREEEQHRINYEKEYKRYAATPQPRITGVKVEMNIFPKERNYNAIAYYTMVNKTGQAIDSLIVDYGENLRSIHFDIPNKQVWNDTSLNFSIYTLERPLQPGDTLQVKILSENVRNHWLADESPVLENGTFINNFELFPGFGYQESTEIVDNDVRKKYGLKDRERMAEPTDMQARRNNYISNNADWMSFEATVSTSEDQIAIAPGYLQKEWTENGRKYFHYKMDKPILNFYAFNSARYDVRKEEYKGVSMEIYYQKGHEYNLDRMMSSLKHSLDYYTENFSPYQHRQVRIVEFPRTQGSFAQSFPNTIPYSESVGFIAWVDEDKPNAVDYPYSVTAHELAHQWWAHQVIGAHVKGATLMSESLAEYSSLRVLEKRYGKFQMRKFLKDALDKYLLGRAAEWKSENALMYNENQQYIHYNKGSLVLYAMSDYLGEKNFNRILKGYIEDVAFQEPPYTTSLEFVDHIRRGTPDSLQYLIKDMFETITLYNNKVDKVTSKELPNGKYQVDIDFKVAKYRTDKKGKRIYEDMDGKTLTDGAGKKALKSLPLADYIEVGVFGEKKKKGNYEYDNEIYLKRYKISKISNRVSVIVDEKPVEVGVDPYNKLIDTDSNDNRRGI
ncbi:ABC transporter permease/M1 family aminopeptidase [Leadbetterella sp. DM7]|uniref:ABC transporter permease/M1 family aminopeptidase n=1 Tax=Leadbetterella sp. DM7 TaxID=3235085 RepID=UPI00349E7543